MITCASRVFDELDRLRVVYQALVTEREEALEKLGSAESDFADAMAKAHRDLARARELLASTEAQVANLIRQRDDWQRIAELNLELAENNTMVAEESETERDAVRAENEKLRKAVTEHVLAPNGHFRTCGGACELECVEIRAALIRRAKSPVHVVLKEEESIDGEVELPGWYFWDETWAYRHGPFATRGEAQAACRRYAEIL